MAKVAGKDRTVFEEMYKTVLENFTPHDMMQIEENGVKPQRHSERCKETPRSRYEISG
jgi:hypothetical protein